MSQNTDLPGEDSQKLNSESPVNPQSVTGTNTGITNTNTLTDQLKKDMEVHHHGHVHERKKWKEYVFQFFMLLLAVFLGSYAETKREEMVEDNRQHEYIESMVADLTKDTAEINLSNRFISEQIDKMDSLETLLRDDLKNNKARIFKSYQLSGYLFWYSTAVFNEKTFSQLISSGGMRIIRKKDAADRIMEYYNSIKRIDQQKQQYLAYINRSLEEIYKVFDVSILRRDLDRKDSILYWAPIDTTNIHLRTTNADALADLGAMIEKTKFVIDNYRLQLVQIRENANSLLLFLKEKYDLKD